MARKLIQDSAEEIEQIARQVINDVPEHQDLQDVKIGYLFDDQLPKLDSEGGMTWAYARKVPIEMLVYDEKLPWFIIVVNKYQWDALDTGERKALIDHELCHCRIKIDKNGLRSAAMRKHDYSEFLGVVERHGAWTPSLKHMASHMQTEMDFGQEETLAQAEEVLQ